MNGFICNFPINYGTHALSAYVAGNFQKPVGILTRKKEIEKVRKYQYSAALHYLSILQSTVRVTAAAGVRKLQAPADYQSEAKETKVKQFRFLQPPPPLPPLFSLRLSIAFADEKLRNK